MNTLSSKTLGHLIETAAAHPSRDAQALLLRKSGIYELEGFDSSDLDNYEERSSIKISQPPLQHAHQRAVGGDYDAHEALLEIIRLSVERIARPPEDNKVLELRESLLSDGYELQFDPAGTRKCQLLPIDPDGIPVRAEITALEAELDQRGYDEAKEHYLSAVRHFTEQVHSSANGQLRNMVESLVKNLAIDHAGYVDTGKANQGSQAIKKLYVKGGRPPATIGDPLPERDGGGMLQGIWDILHPNGSHPGLSNADEARIRMQLCAALARFLLKHFPEESEGLRG